MIKTADHIIDMGPEGGVNGGKIIAEREPQKKCLQVKIVILVNLSREIIGNRPMKKTA